MVNAVLNSRFDIFCTLPLVEGYKVDLFAFLCWDYFVFSPSSSFCICNFVALLMAGGDESRVCQGKQRCLLSKLDICTARFDVCSIPLPLPLHLNMEH